MGWTSGNLRALLAYPVVRSPCDSSAKRNRSSTKPSLVGSVGKACLLRAWAKSIARFACALTMDCRKTRLGKRELCHERQSTQANMCFLTMCGHGVAPCESVGLRQTLLRVNDGMSYLARSPVSELPLDMCEQQTDCAQKPPEAFVSPASVKERPTSMSP